MTISATYDGAAITHKWAPSALSIPTRADNGEASTGSLPLEDPAGTLTVVGHRPFTVVESACTQPRLFTGWTRERAIARSEDRGMFVGPEPALHDMTVVDLNALWRFRIISGTDGNRPEETINARVAWIMGSDYLAGLIEDTGYVVSSTLTMDACDYRTRFPGDVFNDIIDRVAEWWTYHAFWDAGHSPPCVALFMDQYEAATYDSTLSISNDVADIDSTTCFAPFIDAVLSREPDETYSEVILEYYGGARVFRSRASTAATYIRRGTSISRPFTGKTATAITQAEGFLDLHQAELDRITVTIRVPAASVGLVTAGMRMEVKFTHLPTYATATWMRVVACSPKPVDDLALYYDVALELVKARVTTPGGGGGGECDPSGRTLEIVQSTTTWTADVSSITATLGAAPTCGNMLVAVLSMRSGGMADGTIASWTKLGPYHITGDDTLSILYKIAEASDTAAVTVSGTGLTAGSFWVGEIGGAVLDVYGVTENVDNTGGPGDIHAETTITPTAGADVLLLSVSAWKRGGDQYLEPSPIEGGTEVWNVTATGGLWPWTNINWRTVADATGSYTGGSSITAPELVNLYSAAVLLSFRAPTDTTIPLAPPIPPQTQGATDPTVDEDADAGYHVGSLWVNTATGSTWILVDNTNGAAVWTLLTTSSLNFSTSDGVTTVNPTWQLTFVGATLDDLGSGVAEVTISGAPADADYLVGTAQAGLSAEIVVGATPGGELGGTWASPTVDATHSGSAHLALGSTSSTAAAGDHTHASASGVAFILADGHSTPFVFADLLQNEAGDDFLYADP